MGRFSDAFQAHLPTRPLMLLELTEDDVSKERFVTNGGVN